MQHIIKSWRGSLQFALDPKNLLALVKTAWQLGSHIAYLSALVLGVSALNDLSVQQYLTYTPISGIGFSTVYLMAYYDFSWLFFVPFMLQGYEENSSEGYSYYLRRWLVWYSLALVLGIFFSVPVRVCVNLLPQVVCSILSLIVRGVTAMIFMALPVIVVHHVQTRRDFSGMLHALWYGSWLYVLEFPVIVAIAIAVSLLWLVQVLIVGLIGQAWPYGELLFSLYGKVAVAQTVWSLLLALYKHRSGAHTEAEVQAVAAEVEIAEAKAKARAKEKKVKPE